MTGSARREAGYNLVMLMVVVAVVHVAVAAALPLWSTAMQREKEEELIFRGLQYAEAIRVFQQRHGRLPVRLEELVKVEPRCLRQLWKDPMTDSADWGLVLAAGGGRQVAVGDPQGRGKENPGDPAGDVGTPGRGPKLPQGPIQGVFSRSGEESIKVFFDRSRYNQWKFTVDLVTAPAVPPGTPNAPPRIEARWIGRPFRAGVVSPGPTAPQAPGEGGFGTPGQGSEGRPAGPGGTRGGG